MRESWYVMGDRVVLTQFVLDWLSRSQLPRVLHVFERACNLINERDEIISVVWPELRAGPFAIVLVGERPFTQITTDAEVNITSSRLQIASLQIELANAILWPPRPDWLTIHKIAGFTDPHPNLPPVRGKELTPSPCKEESWGEGNIEQTVWSKILPCLQATLTEHAPSETAVFQPKLDTAQQELLIGLQQNNRVKIESGAKQLAGLGQGVTPTGDDFLVGAMIALWTTGYDLDVIDLIVQTAVPRTTLLSGAWLQAAGRGELVVVWHDFFAGLEDGGWETAVSKILQIGHSSGYDALSGFTAVLDSVRA